MAETEDDEHIDAFLSRYASQSDLSADNLRYLRYFRRDEWDRYGTYRARRLFACLDALLDRKRTLRDDDGVLRAESLYDAALFQEKLLDALAIGEEEAPVDAWTLVRIQAVFDKGAALSSLGRHEEALDVLEKGIRLLERVMEITDKIPIPSGSRWLKPFDWHAEEDWSNINNNPDGELQRMIFISEKNGGWCYCIYPQQFADALTGGRWSDLTSFFDPIRGDPRFLACVSRVEALCVSKPAEDNAE